MSKPWERYWFVIQTPAIAKFGEHGGQWWVYDSESPDKDSCDSPIMGYQGPPIPEEYARLAAAAPALVRALLMVELKGDLGDYGPGCAACGGPGYKEDGEHTRDRCPVDEALTAAGLDTKEKRDEARAKLPIWVRGK